MKLKTFLLFVCCSIQLSGYSQHFFVNDSTYSKKRTITTTSTLAVGWSGSIAALSTVWYTEPKTSFTFFNDANNWLQMDKAGHVFAASHLTQRGTELFKWCGLSQRKSLLFGSIFGFGFQTSFEILDGFSPDYGFSWSDIGANALGTSNYILQDIIWKEQKIKLKFSAHLTEFAQFRPNVLGKTFVERILKDYNGQTYWISFSLAHLFKVNTKFPKWINLSVGYSVNELLFGSITDTYTIDIPWEPTRRSLLSLDIDLEKIPVKKPWLKAVLKQFNTLKVPFPTLEFSKSGVVFHPFYF